MQRLLKKIWVILLLIVMGCGGDQKKIEIPQDVIKKEAFSSIMVDVLILEGYRSKMVKPTDSLNTNMQAFYKDIFEKHNTNKKAYDRSYKFYSNHPEMMLEIYEMAETEFKLKEDAVTKDRKEKLESIGKTKKNNPLIPGKK